MELRILLGLEWHLGAACVYLSIVWKVTSGNHSELCLYSYFKPIKQLTTRTYYLFLYFLGEGGD